MARTKQTARATNSKMNKTTKPKGKQSTKATKTKRAPAAKKIVRKRKTPKAIKLDNEHPFRIEPLKKLIKHFFPEDETYRVAAKTVYTLRMYLENRLVEFAGVCGELTRFSKRETIDYKTVLAAYQILYPVQKLNCDITMDGGKFESVVCPISDSILPLEFAKKSQIKLLMKYGSGIHRVSESAVPLIREFLLQILQQIVRDAVVLMELSKRKQLTFRDVTETILRLYGTHIYNVDMDKRKKKRVAKEVSEE